METKERLSCACLEGAWGNGGTAVIVLTYAVGMCEWLDSCSDCFIP
jgi:hypothetical protein